MLATVGDLHFSQECKQKKDPRGALGTCTGATWAGDQPPHIALPGTRGRGGTEGLAVGLDGAASGG